MISLTFSCKKNSRKNTIDIFYAYVETDFQIGDDIYIYRNQESITAFYSHTGDTFVTRPHQMTQEDLSNMLDFFTSIAIGNFNRYFKDDN